MKALRYLLIVIMVSVASMVFATAQSLAQRPEAQMKSTSGMVYSGSTLPSAATDGAVLTGSKPGTYSPANASTGGMRKAKRAGEDDGFEDEGDEPGAGNPGEPAPLGDAALPLALLALAYMCARAFLKKRA